jgi:hypothetical protein
MPSSIARKYLWQAWNLSAICLLKNSQRMMIIICADADQLGLPANLRNVENVLLFTSN